MKVSIIIPVYNVEKYLRECLESVIAQTYTNLEIILVNDGSTDNSEEICREYELKYSFIKLINKENGGLSDARNVGILNSTGEYILFLDSDDYWSYPTFLSDLVQYIINYPKIDYVFFRYKIYYQKKDIYIEPKFNLDDKELFGKSGIECLDYILSEMEYFQWFAVTGIVRKEFLRNNDLFFLKGIKFEDMLWTPQIFIKAELIGFFNHPVYIYRLEREGQITSEASFELLKDIILVCEMWANSLKKLLIKEELKKKLIININSRYFLAIKYAGFLKNNEKKQIISLLKKNKHFMKYCKGINKVIMFLCNTIGFTLTVSLVYLGINLKRNFINQGVK